MEATMSACTFRGKRTVRTATPPAANGNRHAFEAAHVEHQRVAEEEVLVANRRGHAARGKEVSKLAVVLELDRLHLPWGVGTYHARSCLVGAP